MFERQLFEVSTSSHQAVAAGLAVSLSVEYAWTAVSHDCLAAFQP